MLKKPWIWTATLVALEISSSTFAQEQQAENDDFAQFQQQQQTEFAQFQQQRQSEFDQFVKQWRQAEAAYKADLAKTWNTVELSGKKRFVSYSDQNQQKTVVDYERNTVTIEVQGQVDQKALMKRLQDRLKQLQTTEVKQAVKDDPVIKRLPTELQQSARSNSRLTLLEASTGSVEVVTEFEQASAEKTVKETPTQSHNKTSSLTVKLPQSTAQKRVQRILPTVTTYAQKHGLPVELVLAIIHTESSFNPMARSHIPAFGLMQIVPTSAGRDVSQYLFGSERIFSPAYLFDAEQNVEAGSVYFYLLSQRYFKQVTNSHSRELLAIAAYNTGPGNVAETFGRGFSLTQASEAANTMTPSTIKQHLLRYLPAQETKNYLKKITKRRLYYQQLLETL